MARGWLIGGGVAALLAGIAATALAVLLATTATAEDHVARYLSALADDDLPTAAALAGLPPDAPLPLGDEGRPSVVRVVAAQDRGDGVTAVTVEYGSPTDAATAIFLIEPAAPLWGFVPQWRFVEPPVAALPVGLNNHDRVTVSTRVVTTPGPGEPAPVEVFVPARVSVTSTDPFVDATARYVRVRSTSPLPVILSASPSDRLLRAVERELAEFLDTCTEQTVLQPTGCPFGRIIEDDRVIDRPQWERTTPVRASLEASRNAGRWQLTGTATLRLTASVQSLFDGSVTLFVDDVAAEIVGVVIVGADGPVVTVYP